MLLAHLRSAFLGQFLPKTDASADQKYEWEEMITGADTSTAVKGAGAHTGAGIERRLHGASTGVGMLPERHTTIAWPIEEAKVTGTYAFRDTGPEQDEWLSATRHGHQERSQRPREQAVHLDDPKTERAAAEGRLEEDKPPEGRLDEKREAHTGLETERDTGAVVRGPGGAQALEEEEEDLEEVQDP